MFKENVLVALKKLLKKDVVLEVPPDSSLGDVAFPCFNLAKDFKKSPQIIAKDIADKLSKENISGVDKIVVVGAYVNFFFKKDRVAASVIDRIIKERESFGSCNDGKGKVVCIDYSHPNIAKPFGIGHLRSSVIGRAIYLLLKFSGYKPVGLNYLGDWGTPHGKIIAGFLKWGDKEKLKKQAIKHLLDIYVKFTAAAEKDPKLMDEARLWFSKLEKNDSQAVKLWAKFRHLSLLEFMRIYKVINLDFESYEGESSMVPHVPKMYDFLKNKGLVVESEGAMVVEVPNLPPCILRKSDEASTYALRDLTAIKYRHDTYNSEEILYVVGHEQALHFKQVFFVAEKAGLTHGKLLHIPFGLYMSPEGGKMSTRKGKLVFLEDVINETIKKARKTIMLKNPKLKNKGKVARQVGVGAIIFGDLVNDRVKDVLFDWDKILEFEGDTGPYLQYTYARASSVLRKANSQKVVLPQKANYSLLNDDSEVALINVLSLFPQKVKDALSNYKPHIVAQHLLVLARTFNEFYHACPVLTAQSSELRDSRLVLIEASRIVLRNGLGLLNIEVPEEM